MNPTMSVSWIFRHAQQLEHLLTTADARFETLSYLARQNKVDVLAPCDRGPLAFVRGTPPPISGLFTVYGETDFAAVCARLKELHPQVVIYEGCPVDEDEPAQVRAAVPEAFHAFYYGGGPFLAIDGQPYAGLKTYDVLLVPHRAQARQLQAFGLDARVTYGIPTNRYLPMPEVPKLWHVLCPTAFVPSKRPALVAQYVEQFAPMKPSLFLGRLEHLAVIEMVREGGIPLNMGGAHRNNIRLGGHAPNALMPMVYNSAEVCIVGSQEEGHPNTIMEAMACGTPCILMADCEWEVAAAFRELQDEYGQPLVVEPSPSAIHRGVQEILSAYDTHAKAARRAILGRYEWCDHFYIPLDAAIRTGLGLKLAGQTVAAA